MLHRKKENNAICSSINWSSNLVNNVLVSKCSLPRFQHKVTVLFHLKLKRVSLTLCQKVVNTVGRNFLTVGENLRRSDFDNWNITEHQLKSKLAWSGCQQSMKSKQIWYSSNGYSKIDIFIGL